MANLGARLKKEREKKGITLEEVSFATKIGTRMLRAIEDEQFELLPGGVFNKGFIRAYAKHLGLDEVQALEDYKKAIEPNVVATPVAEVADTEQESPKASSAPLFKAAAALGVVVLGLVLWGMHSRSGRQAESSPGSNAVEDAAPPSTAPAKQEHSGTAKSVTPAVMSVQSKGSAPLVNVSATTTLPSGFQVKIVANEDSWMQITADGQAVMEDVLLAQGVKAVEAQKQLVIKVGNVGGLDFWFNGKRLSAQGDLDQVKTLTFDSSGLVASSVRMAVPGSQIPAVR